MEQVTGYPGVSETTGSLEEIAAQMSREKAQQYQLQAKQFALQGRQVEANIANQKAQIELRKAELAQQRYLTERSQQLQASGMMANLRGPGNAAQFIDLGRRLSSFGTQSGALAEIAGGGMPQGSFSPGSGGRPTSLQERMSGMLGAPSEGAINQRDTNDANLARTISEKSGQLARGSLESLSPFELKYLSSYVESPTVAHDWESTLEAYKRAGIQQGRR